MNVGIKDFKTVLQKAREEGIKLEIQALRCKDCKNWAGRCLNGKTNKIADSPCCEDVDPR